jgi:hypothetical protein
MKTALIFFISFFFFENTFGKIVTHHKETKAWPFYDSENRGFDPQRLIYGGDFGLDFIKRDDVTKDRGFNFGVSGLLGYRFGQRLMLGTSFGYNYLFTEIEYRNLRNSDVFEKIDIKSKAYDIAIVGRYFLSRNFFITAQPRMNYWSDWTTKPDYNEGVYKFTAKKMEVFSCLTGIGIVLPLGENAAFIMQGLYDVVQDTNSPYNNLPMIRGGINIGFF